MASKNVFVSYAREDEYWADWASQELKKAKLTSWVDRDNMLSEDWERAIAEHIPASDCVLVLASRSSRVSKGVAKEVHLAMGHAKPVCWASLDPEARKHLEAGTFPNHPHEINVLSLESAWGRILATIQRFVGSALTLPAVRHWAVEQTERDAVVLVASVGGDVRVAPWQEIPTIPSGGTGGPVLADQGNTVVTSTADGIHVHELTNQGTLTRRNATYYVDGVLDVLSAGTAGMFSVMTRTEEGWVQYRLTADGRAQLVGDPRIGVARGAPLRAAATCRAQTSVITEEGLLRQGGKLFVEASEKDRCWVDIDAASNQRSALVAALSQSPMTQYLHMIRLVDGLEHVAVEHALDKQFDSVRVARTPVWGAVEPYRVFLRRGDEIEECDAAVPAAPGS